MVENKIFKKWYFWVSAIAYIIYNISINLPYMGYDAEALLVRIAANFFIIYGVFWIGMKIFGKKEKKVEERK